jgi:hypothetical protein
VHPTACSADSSTSTKLQPEIEFVQPTGELLVTYNVNSLVFQDLMNGVHIYRPRFIWVKLPPIVTAP